jgi:hypothetical protein
MLTAARLTEDAALGSMRQTFQIMARADNLQSLDPQDCSGLAQRLLQSMEDFANLGAALPDGTVFCSASPGQTRGVGDGPQLVPGSPERRGASLRANSSQGAFLANRAWCSATRCAMPTAHSRPCCLHPSSWTGFDKLIAEFKLPQGWNAFLLSDTGTVLSYHPRGQPPTPDGAGARRRGPVPPGTAGGAPHQRDRGPGWQPPHVRRRVAALFPHAPAGGHRRTAGPHGGAHRPGVSGGASCCWQALHWCRC